MEKGFPLQVLVCEITNYCDRKTKELPSCGVHCNMTLPCWLCGTQSPSLRMNLSIDRAGLVVNVSITHRTLEHGGESFTKQNLHCALSHKSHPKMPEVVGGRTSHL